MVKKANYIPQKGDIVWLNFCPQAGHEQKGRRPALVISSNAYNKKGLMIACPITSKVKGYPFEVKISGVKIQGAVLADHVKNQDWRAREAEFIEKADQASIVKVQKLITALVLQ